MRFGIGRRAAATEEEREGGRGSLVWLRAAGLDADAGVDTSVGDVQAKRLPRA
jgi:hypothetical protein